MRPAAEPTAGQRPPEGPGQGVDPGRIVAFSTRALGSALRMTVRLPVPSDAGRRAAASAWAEVRDEFDAVDRALSRFRDDSELTDLNRLAGSGRVVRVSWRLRRALSAVDRAGRMTDGRFDASVLGALERIGEHGADLAAGDGEAAGDDEDTRLVGSAALPPMSTSSLVHAPSVPVDMGGIGKGLALRWARDRAIAALPPGAGLLLDAGGDLVVGGEPSGDGWLVGIEDPVASHPAEGDPLVVVRATEGAVATSSVAVRSWRGPDGAPVHHLVDPRSGTSAHTGLIAVSVAWRDPAWAEVWSKALFLAGRREIADEARRRGLAAWWVDESGHLGMTPGARIRTEWAQEDRLG